MRSHRVRLRSLELVLVTVALGAGCRRAGDRSSASADSATGVSSDVVTPPVARPDTPVTPLLTTTDSAVSVIRDYYAAIREHDYARAYAMWSDSGRASGQRFDEFARGFTETARVEVTVGVPGRIEGAAGSRYIEVPVQVAARTRDGTPQRFSGRYVLRRAVVTGATPAQRRWHIYSAHLERARR